MESEPASHFITWEIYHIPPRTGLNLVRVATSVIPKEAKASKFIWLLINCIIIYFIFIREGHLLQGLVAQDRRNRREKENKKGHSFLAKVFRGPQIHGVQRVF
jgi:hypothetical protein